MRVRSNEMSEQFEIRKLQAMGSRGVACMNTHNSPHSYASVIPQAFVEQLGLKKGDFVKLGLEGKRIWMEKLTQ